MSTLTYTEEEAAREQRLTAWVSGDWERLVMLLREKSASGGNTIQSDGAELAQMELAVLKLWGDGR